MTNISISINALLITIFLLIFSSCSPILNTELSNPNFKLDNSSFNKSKNLFIKVHNITGIMEFNIHSNIVEYVKKKGYTVVDNIDKAEIIVKIILNNYKYKKYNFFISTLTSPVFLFSAGYAMFAKLLNANNNTILAGAAAAGIYGASLSRNNNQNKLSCCNDYMSIVANIVTFSKQKEPMTIKTSVNTRQVTKNNVISSNMIVNYDKNYSQNSSSEQVFKNSNIYFEKKTYFKKQTTSLHVQANGIFLLKKNSLDSLLSTITSSLHGIF